MKTILDSTALIAQAKADLNSDGDISATEAKQSGVVQGRYIPKGFAPGMAKGLEKKLAFVADQLGDANGKPTGVEVVNAGVTLLQSGLAPGSHLVAKVAHQVEPSLSYAAGKKQIDANLKTLQQKSAKALSIAESSVLKTQLSIAESAIYQKQYDKALKYVKDAELTIKHLPQDQRREAINRVAELFARIAAHTHDEAVLDRAAALKPSDPELIDTINKIRDILNFRT